MGMNRPELSIYLQMAEGALIEGSVIRCARHLGSAIALTDQEMTAFNPDLALRAAIIQAVRALEDGDTDAARREIIKAGQEQEARA